MLTFAELEMSLAPVLHELKALVQIPRAWLRLAAEKQSGKKIRKDLYYT